MVLCGSSLRPPRVDGGAGLVRVASECGFDGVALDGGCTLADVPALFAEAGRNRLPCPIVFGPLSEGPLLPGRRLPDVAALDDKDERQAAVKTALATIEAVRGFGARQFVLELGRVPLALTPPVLRRFYSRRELDEDEPGWRPFRRAVEERKAKSDAVLDACRAGLDALLPGAERFETTVFLGVARSMWGSPSPREVQVLLHEFRGAPLAFLAAPARRKALAEVGLAGPPERWQGLDETAGALYATDGVGLQSNLLPGLGEVDFGTTEAPENGPRIVGGRPDSSASEMAKARLLIAGLRARTTRS